MYVEYGARLRWRYGIEDGEEADTQVQHIYSLCTSGETRRRISNVNVLSLLDFRRTQEQY